MFLTEHCEAGLVGVSGLRGIPVLPMRMLVCIFIPLGTSQLWLKVKAHVDKRARDTGLDDEQSDFVYSSDP